MASPTVRHRKIVEHETTTTTVPVTSPGISVEKIPRSRSSSPSKSKRTNNDGGIGLLDIARMLTGALGIFFLLSYFITDGESLFFNRKPSIFKASYYHQLFNPPKLFTEDQLAEYDGSNPNLPILLAVNGSVFDVSANPGTYGPGGSYHFFTGKDATRAFVSGCFQQDLTHDLRGLENAFLEEDKELEAFEKGELADLSNSRRAWLVEKQKRRRDRARQKVKDSVDHWEQFFMKNERYPYVGRVVLKSVADKPVPQLCKGKQKG